MLGTSNDKSSVNGQSENARSQPSEASRRERPLSTLPVVFTVMGDRAKITGNFEIANSIQIECEIEGKLKVGRKLIVGQNGVVNADVQTVDAVIEGQYEGHLKASGSVEIMTGARVTGTIETDSIVIARGAFFNGSVHGLLDEDADRSPIDRLDPALVTPGSNSS